MSALTPYRLARLDGARRELTTALDRLDRSHDDDPRDVAVRLFVVHSKARTLAELARRYDRHLVKTFRPADDTQHGSRQHDGQGDRPPTAPRGASLPQAGSSL